MLYSCISALLVINNHLVGFYILTHAVEEYEFRTTVPPGYLDGDDIEKIARSLGGARNYVLQNFQPVDCIDPAMAEVAPLRPDVIREYADRQR